MLVQPNQVASKPIKTSEGIAKISGADTYAQAAIDETRRPSKHSDISKFFKGKGQKPHSTYRRMVKERKKPEDIQ